ncbi:hypothetical protein [Tenacibaculum aestuariivivum]|uniref:TlpA family protein disulfide reductase n=1 Tax=Tenacibaculum aestuariivivum TaxID=2006131 RepID=UPI003AB58ACC
MTKYLAPFILILLISCKESKTPKTTYFGGKIINPKTNYITLSDNYSFNDTIYLKKDNSFFTSLKNVKKGLYKFQHGPEHQYVYLEPNDSLLLRLNTWAFDESLVFSGKDAERNNLLIEAFLQTEQDENDFSKFYKLNQQEFLKKIDSIKQVKKQLINNYKNNTINISNEFIEILNIALLYPVYTNLEEYAICNFRKEKPEKLVHSYFNYRNSINTRKDSLIFFSPYYSFIIDKLYNDVYLNKNRTDNFTVDLLNNINTSITSEEIKNKLLYNSVVRHFFKEPNQKNKKESFFTFFKLNTNIEHKKNIQRLINDLKLLKEGQKLPSFDLVDATGESKNILKIIKGKNTIILFKDYQYASDEWIASRINHLIKNNPNIKFIVVNLGTTSKKYTKGIAIKYQYTAPKNSTIYKYSSSKFPRMILIDKKGVIKNSYLSLSSKNNNFNLK